MEPWAWAIIVPVALALVGAIAFYVLRDNDRLERRLDEHIKEDTKVHERVAVNESELKRLNAEIGDRKSGIRGWLHELANEITPRSLSRQQREREGKE